MLIAMNIVARPTSTFMMCLFTNPFVAPYFWSAHVDEALYTTTVLATIKKSTTMRMTLSI